MKKFILLLSLALGFGSVQAQDVKTYIPKNAYPLLPLIKTETERLFPGMEFPEYFGGLMEHESCISLTHSRCFSSTSQLKTAREWGAGLGQLTQAYNPDGSVRFDSLADLRRAHMQELSELSWGNITQRPDLQIRGVLLMTRDNTKKFWEVKDDKQRFKFADASYNAGPGRVAKMRLQCSLTQGCNPQYWDDNAERINVIGNKVLYGNRTAYMIMTHHVHDVFVRKDKYIPYLRLSPPPTVRLGG